MTIKLRERTTDSSGVRLIVIDEDIEHCKLLGGEFVESDICINPFSVICEEEFERSTSYRDAVTQLINLLLRQMYKATTDIEHELIREAFEATWRQHGSESTIANVSSFLLGKGLGNPGSDYSGLFDGKANLSESYYIFDIARFESKPGMQLVIVMLVAFLLMEKTLREDTVFTPSLAVEEGRVVLVLL